MISYYVKDNLKLIFRLKLEYFMMDVTQLDNTNNDDIINMILRIRGFPDKRFFRSYISMKKKPKLLMNIGESIKYFREKKGLSQGDMARSTGMERTYVNRIENNKIQYPRLETIKKISLSLNISIDEIIDKAVEIAKQDRKKIGRVKEKISNN